MRYVQNALLGITVVFWSLSALGQPAPSQTEWINAVRAGGHVIVIRHGATHTDQADSDPLNLKNVAQQRQLNDRGRELARSIGESLHKLRIPVGSVYTSMFQRAVDTGALLGFGDSSPPPTSPREGSS